MDDTTQDTPAQLALPIDGKPGAAQVLGMTVEAVVALAETYPEAFDFATDEADTTDDADAAQVHPVAVRIADLQAAVAKRAVAETEKLNAQRLAQLLADTQEADAARDLQIRTMSSQLEAASTRVSQAEDGESRLRKRVDDMMRGKVPTEFLANAFGELGETMYNAARAGNAFVPGEDGRNDYLMVRLADVVRGLRTADRSTLVHTAVRNHDTPGRRLSAFLDATGTTPHDLADEIDMPTRWIERATQARDVEPRDLALWTAIAKHFKVTLRALIYEPVTNQLIGD